jgi:hypothetical protein
MAIIYESLSPKREVHYTPRTADKAPTAWVVTAKDDSLAAFEADLHSAGSGTTMLVHTVEATGLAADVVADMWVRYRKLREAVAEAKDPVDRWTAWASGKLAVRGVVEAPATMQRQWLLFELAAQKTALQQQYGANSADLHPVAAAMQEFMYGQEQLGSMNGSTPKRELLPDVTFVSPVEAIGMIALDLAQQAEFANAASLS